MKLNRVEPDQYLVGRPPGKTRLLLEEVLLRPAGGAPSIVMGTLYWQKAPSFGWDVKPRSWLTVVIKNLMSLLIKSRGVTPVLAKFPPLASDHNGLLIIPIHLIGSMNLSPPAAGVWWAHWRHCPVAAVASSKWMLHTGGGWGETPPHDCKALWVCSYIQ